MSGSASTTTDESASTSPTATASAPRVSAGLPGSGANQLDPIPLATAESRLSLPGRNLDELRLRRVGGAQCQGSDRAGAPSAAGVQVGVVETRRDLVYAAPEPRLAQPHVEAAVVELVAHLP